MAAFFLFRYYKKGLAAQWKIQRAAVAAAAAVAVAAAAVAVLFSHPKRPFWRILDKTDVTMLISAKKRFRWSNFQLKRS